MKDRINVFFKKTAIPVVLSGILMAIVAVSPGALNPAKDTTETYGPVRDLYSGIPRTLHCSEVMDHASFFEVYEDFSIA